MYQVWKHDNRLEELESYKFLKQKLEYLHLNPSWDCTKSVRLF